MVPAHPMKTTGLRPILSDNAPQAMPLHASAYTMCKRAHEINADRDLTSEKAEISRPAKNGALDSEDTSKFSTSFHAYGSILVRAIGSATRTSAAVDSKNL